MYFIMLRYVCVGGSDAHVSTGALWSQRLQNFLELELEAVVVSCLTWVLRMELGSSGRVRNALELTL